MAQLDDVRALAQEIVDSLGAEPAWSVLGVRTQPAGLVEAAVTDAARITVGPPGGPTSVSIYFSMILPEAVAVVAFAEQLQVRVVTSVEQFAVALPPCPEHPHPLSAEVVGGVPMWVCPEWPQHHQRPILRRASPVQHP